MGLKKYDEKAELEKIAKEKADSIPTEEDLKEESDLTDEAKDIEETTEGEQTEVVEEEFEADLDDTTFRDKAEVSRTEYNNYNKRQKKFRWINTACFLLIEIIGFVFIICNDYIGSNIGIIVGIVILILGIVAYFIVGKKMSKDLTSKAYEYIGKLFNDEADYLFRGNGIIDITVDGKGDVPTEVFTDAHFYQNIKSVRSRNVVHGTFNGSTILIADLAGNVIVKNKTSPMFLGKLYEYKCKYSKPGSYVLYQLKGGELSRPLDNVQDLELKEETKKYVVYSNDNEYKKILTDKVLRTLNKFKVDGKLIDVILSIRDGRVVLGIDYADDYMNIPVDSEVDIKIFKRMKSDFLIVREILNLLN